jgi:CRISPR-associated protein Cas1
VNALLSFVYTLLYNDVKGALESVGLDSAVGYLHRDRPGRHGLALDLMEEMRTFWADRLALTLINRQQLSAKDFDLSDTGSVLLNEKGRKTVLVAWQKRKQDEITHSFTGEHMLLGLLPFLQAQLLARFMRGDLDAYPPYFWR